MMETLKFTTNIKCQGCLAVVTPFMNQLKGVVRWNVDLAHPLRILTVECSGISPEKVIAALSKAGYQANPV
jgi:copper chaperone CopZ